MTPFRLRLIFDPEVYKINCYDIVYLELKGETGAKAL